MSALDWQWRPNMFPIAEKSAVCILNAQRQPIGGGVFIRPDIIATCTHVLNAALNRTRNDTVRPGERFTIARVTDPQKHIEADAAFSWPFGGSGDADVTLLRCVNRPGGDFSQPTSTSDWFLGKEASFRSHQRGLVLGVEVHVEVTSIRPDGWLQISGTNDHRYWVGEGASGCGLFVGESLIGLVAFKDVGDEVREGLAINSERIIRALNFLDNESVASVGEIECTTSGLVPEIRLARSLTDPQSRVQAVPIFPGVFMYQVPHEVIIAYARFLANPVQAELLVQSAMNLVARCDNEGRTERQMLVDPGERIGAAHTSPLEFWSAVFAVACMKSRRTLAALLIVEQAPDPRTLSGKERDVFARFVDFVCSPKSC